MSHYTIKMSSSNLYTGSESLIKSEKTSTNSMFGKNVERFEGSWFSVTHPTTPHFIDSI